MKPKLILNATSRVTALLNAPEGCQRHRSLFLPAP